MSGAPPRRGPARRVAAAVLLAAWAAPAGAAGGQAAPDRFDGTWSVEILTEAGTCDRAYRYPVRIERGQARFIGVPITIDGHVTPSGAVAGSISNGLATARVVGRLRRDGLGSGTWTASGSLACRGRWNAARRG